jgi:hypothetical protein
VDDQEFQAELSRLLEEEVPKVRLAEAHAEIDALLRQLELVGQEFARYSNQYRTGSSHAVRMNALACESELLPKHTEILLQLLEIARAQPEHARSHEGLMALAGHLGGPAWGEALGESEQ